MHMRTTLNLDDALLDEARRITGIDEKTALIHRGLEELIARQKRARPGGIRQEASPRLHPIPRRRPRSSVK